MSQKLWSAVQNKFKRIRIREKSIDIWRQLMEPLLYKLGSKLIAIRFESSEFLYLLSIIGLRRHPLQSLLFMAEALQALQQIEVDICTNGHIFAIHI